MSNDLISRSHFDDRVRLAAGPDADEEFSADFLDGIKVVLYMLSTEPAAKQPTARNVGKDYAEQDQFICSECGIHLQDWVRIDEDDYEDGIVHEYAFQFCPNCGRRIDDER